MIDIAHSYAILGVSYDISDEDLKRAYRDLVRVWHPDKLTHDPKRHKQAETRLKEINQAYSTVRSQRSNGHGNGRSTAETASNTRPTGQTGRIRRTRSTEDDESRYIRFNAEAAERYQEGREHAEGARWDEAISAFMQSVCLQPNNGDAYFELGDAYGEAGRPAKSAAAFKQAIRLRPDRNEAYSRLAQACLEMDDPREAVWACSRLRRRSALTAADLTTLGIAYRKLRQYPQSLAALDEAIRLTPTVPLIHYERGETLVASGNVTAAREVYERLQRIDNDLAVQLLLSIIDANTPHGRAREGW